MTAHPRHRLAIYWAGACGGCDIAILNIDEALLDVDRHFEVVFWPAVMDAKVRDVEALPDRSIDVTLFTGGIRTEEHANMARLLRRTSSILVAFGSCAMEGCIPGLANLSTVPELLDTVYEGPSTDNPEHVRPVARWHAPEGEILLSPLQPVLRTLEDIVQVDYSIPGCPPETERIAEVVVELVAALDGLKPLPPSGAILGAGHSTVCDECPRERHEKRLAAFTRIQALADIDPMLCLLEQGLPCNGPATRDGCGALCPEAGAPCIGCYGPTDGVVDQGARLLSAFASIVAASEPDAIEAILDGMPDPVGQAYRFSLARSLLGGARAAEQASLEGSAATTIEPAAQGPVTGPPGEPASTTRPDHRDEPALAGAASRSRP
jgi:F420-non-reducing hydrogenase small subunit